MTQISDIELINILDNKIENAIGADQSDLEEDQAKALDYYHGREYGNEIDGRSKIVTREVLEQIEWTLPSMMRVFASGDRIVSFDPVGPEDEALAKQETDVVNHVFMKDNSGFLILHDWFKDALLQKVGYVKVYWDETEETRTESWQGLDDMQLAEALKLGEPIEHSAYPMQTEQGEILLHDVKVRITDTMGKCVVENIPQEELLVSSNTRSISLDGADFVAHKAEKTVSELVANGYDRKEVLLAADDGDAETELEYSRQTHGAEQDDDEEADESMRKVKVYECYIKVDYDDDGIAEFRRIVKIGSKIFENEEAEYMPFEAITPVPMPHKHIGLSEADLVMDIQLTKSTLLRQMLDNLYLTNNPEKEVDINKIVTMDDLLTSVPGGIKRVEQLGAIREITVPFTAGASMPMMEILDQMKEARTGVSRHTMGLDADTLAQSTKGAFMGAMEQANQRIEMFTRIFSETGVKGLFRKIHAILIKHQDREKTMKIRGKWISINPSEWSDRTDLTVDVGIGTGNKDRDLQQLATLAEKQEMHLLQGSPLVTLKNLYNTYERMVEAAGLKSVDPFFTDPETIEQKPQEEEKPDPQVMLMQQQLQQQMQIATQQAQAKSEKDKGELQFKYDKLQQDSQKQNQDLEARLTELELKYVSNVPGALT